MKKQAVFFYPQLVLTIIICLFLVVPVIQSLLAGITSNYFLGLKSGVTLGWLGQVWSLYSDTIFRSLFVALACLAVNLGVGVPAAYVMVKTRNRLTRLLEEFLMIPLAVPGLAIALAILISYGQLTEFRRSWLIILVGHVIFTLPFMIRAVIAVMSSYNLSDLEEGAASLGAGFWKRFLSVVVPNSMPGILAGSLMVFTLSIGEFNITWMLHTPLTKTLPVGLADSYASMRLEIGSAYTIAFFFMIIPLLLAMQWIAGSGQTFFSGRSAQKRKSMSKTPPAQAEATSRPNPVHTRLQQPQKGMRVRLEHCAKTFPDGTQALEPIDLEIDSGETLAILGPSGCGKTTLLRILAGLESPNRGARVVFGDEDVTRVPIERRQVGMVFQSYALFPNMNVRQNIAYGLKVRGDSRAAQAARAEEMLEMMQIRELAERTVEQLSGGQKQRVALARALAVRPRLLLLDEPLTALDAKLRDTLRIEIDLLLRSLGITAVYVTHDQGEAMSIGDRILVMDHGRVAQIGTPREIYFQSANRFVAEFVGTVNALNAEISNGCLQIAGGALANEALPNLDLPDQGSTTISFRPEHARVVASGSGHFRAEVLSSFFLGDRTRLLVSVPGGDPLRVEAPGTQAYQDGQMVDIRLDESALFTLSD